MWLLPINSTFMFLYSCLDKFLLQMRYSHQYCSKGLRKDQQFLLKWRGFCDILWLGQRNPCQVMSNTPILTTNISVLRIQTITSPPEFSIWPTLKKITAIKNLPKHPILEDRYYKLLEKLGDLKTNYYDYMTTSPIDPERELERLPTANYVLGSAQNDRNIGTWITLLHH